MDFYRGSIPILDADHPTAAAAEFAQAHPEFVLEQPAWLFNESGLSRNLTHWPGAYLRRACRLSIIIGYANVCYA
jgi:hypothetical protein